MKRDSMKTTWIVMLGLLIGTAGCGGGEEPVSGCAAGDAVPETVRRDLEETARGLFERIRAGQWQEIYESSASVLRAEKVICSSGITPGPLGISETSPNAEAPYRTASSASSTLPMQQIFTRHVMVRRSSAPASPGPDMESSPAGVLAKRLAILRGSPITICRESARALVHSVA